MHRNSPISHSKQKPEILLSDIKNLAPAFCKNFQKEILALDFSDDGKLVLCAMFNEIKVFTISQDEEPTEFNIEVDTSGLAKFIGKSGIIFVTNSNTIELTDAFFRKFKNLIFDGHENEITTLKTFKLSGSQFYSAGEDKKVKFWDVTKENKCQREIVKLTQPYVTSHPFSRDIAIISGESKEYSIQLITYKFADKSKFFINFKESVEVCDLEYSPDGQKLLINTKNSILAIIDAKTGVTLYELQGYDNRNLVKIDACFVPGGEFVMTGSFNGYIHCWLLDTGGMEAVLCMERGDRYDNWYRLAWNEQAVCMATAAGKKFIIWVEEK